MNSLKNIKKYLKKNNIEACLISKNNQFLNEFIETQENFLLKISNFTGSLGFALIYKNNQFLYVDGRYTQQAKIQAKNFKIKRLTNLKRDMRKIISSKKKVLLDPKTFSYNFIENMQLQNLVFFNSVKNFKKKQKVFNLTKNYCGEISLKKINQLNKKLNLKKREAFFISSPENIGWLSNIRSKEKNFSKIFNCIALYQNNKLYIFSNQKINIKIKNIIFEKNNKFEKNLLKVNKIYLDKKYTSLYYYNKILEKKIKFKFINDPINILKSIKNSTEIYNLKIAHMFDGIAYFKFLYWLKKNKLRKISEIDCQKKIEFFKNENKYYLGPSFETISATESNASIIHYNAKDYKKTFLKKNHLFLLDSGSQYLFGTTDMTRTIPLGKQNYLRRKIYTIVLKSHISVANTIIKKKISGSTLDKIARKNLIKFGYNYNHGTGHGVGFISNVHESPPSISKLSKDTIYPFQVISNEPGFYKKNDFGIRLENLIYLNSKNKFENLTLVPFERSMIINSMLNKKEKKWINEYHTEVYEKIHKFLSNNEKEYFKNYCLKIN